MIEIGKRPGECSAHDEQIRTIAEGIEMNKIFILNGMGDGLLILSAANTFESMSTVPFARWRVIGIGALWFVASTADEDPIIEFGHVDDNDAYGKMTSAITGGEKFIAGDHVKYDPLNIAGIEVIAETSATLAITWTKGVEFNVWQTRPKDMRVYEAAVAGMTTGYVMPYMIIEVDTGGSW